MEKRNEEQEGVVACRSPSSRAARGMHRIAGFLRAASPNLYCNECLALALGIDRESAQHETVRLTKRDGVNNGTRSSPDPRGRTTICFSGDAVHERVPRVRRARAFLRDEPEPQKLAEQSVSVNRATARSPASPSVAPPSRVVTTE